MPIFLCVLFVTLQNGRPNFLIDTVLEYSGMSFIERAGQASKGGGALIS